MNSVLSSASGLMEENSVGSDSETNSDEDARVYYQPISGVDEDGVGEEEQEDNSRPVNREDQRHGELNGFCRVRQAEEGTSVIGLNGGLEEKSESEEEEEVERETPESAIDRAFREDEGRRSYRLTAENAARVMEAMRAVRFPGVAPDWVSRVPEDRWMDHLRRLRHPS